MVQNMASLVVALYAISKILYYKAVERRALKRLQRLERLEDAHARGEVLDAEDEAEFFAATASFVGGPAASQAHKVGLRFIRCIYTV